MTTQTAYPLSWPAAWQRAKVRAASAFARRSVDTATEEVLRQLKQLGVGDWNVIISTNLALRMDGLPRSNQATPTDPGVAIYFKLRGRERVLACDKWLKVEDNLWAVAKHIEALRGQERWGVGNVEQAFAGYTALPAPGERIAATWYTVLGVRESVSFDEARSAYVAAAHVAHPDKGGSSESMQRLNAAWDMARKHFGR